MFKKGTLLTNPYLDGPIRTNRFADSRESPDSRESFQGSQTEPPFFANRASGGGGVKIANRRFEAICANRSHVVKRSRATKRGDFKRGGFPIWTCPSFFVLFCPFSRFFRDFPNLFGDSSGIFPICPFPLSRPNSSHDEQSRKGLRHNLDLS